MHEDEKLIKNKCWVPHLPHLKGTNVTSLLFQYWSQSMVLSSDGRFYSSLTVDSARFVFVYLPAKIGRDVQGLLLLQVFIHKKLQNSLCSVIYLLRSSSIRFFNAFNTQLFFRINTRTCRLRQCIKVFFFWKCCGISTFILYLETQYTRLHSTLLTRFVFILWILTVQYKGSSPLQCRTLIFLRNTLVLFVLIYMQAIQYYHVTTSVSTVIFSETLVLNKLHQRELLHTVRAKKTEVSVEFYEIN